MGIKLKGIKKMLDNSGIGAAIRTAGTSAVSLIPGVGPVAANILNKLPSAVKPLPGSEGEKTLAKIIQQKVDDTSVPNFEIPSLVVGTAAELVENDASDPRFPLSAGVDSWKHDKMSQKERSGATTKGDQPGWTPPKVTGTGILDALKNNFLLVIGFLIVIAVAMRVPFVRNLIMGGARRVGGYARRTYSTYRARRSRKR